jgi:lysophospholipase L1-like esterase
VPFEGHYAGTVRTNFKQEEETAFIRLLKYFEDDGIPVIFVMAPEFLPGRSAPQFERMTEIIEQIARIRNIPFLNYNTELVSEINSDYSLYSDWGHLNETGAYIFSQKLYEDLNAILRFTPQN